MLVPTKATLKFANINTVHTQGTGIILYHFINCPIIYTVRPVYHCTGHPSNTISLSAFKFYVGFQKVTSEPLEKNIFTLKVVIGDHHTRLKTI